MNRDDLLKIYDRVLAEFEHPALRADHDQNRFLCLLRTPPIGATHVYPLCADHEPGHNLTANEIATLDEIERAMPAPWEVPQFCPPGRTFFTPSNSPDRQMMHADFPTALRLNETLQKYRRAAEAGKQVPCLDKDHNYFSAPGEPPVMMAEAIRFFWGGDDPLRGGIRLQVRWTDYGWQELYASGRKMISPCIVDPCSKDADVPVIVGAVVDQSAFPNEPLKTDALRRDATRDYLSVINELTLPANRGQRAETLQRLAAERPKAFLNAVRLLAYNYAQRQAGPEFRSLLEAMLEVKEASGL